MNIDIKELPLDLLINLLNIFVLYFIVRLLVYKPVKDFMNARTKRIEDEKAEAGKLTEEAKALVATYEEKCKNTQAECAAVLKEKTTEANKQAEAILAEAREEKAAILANAKEQAQRDRDKMMVALEKDVVDMACEITTELLSRQVNEEDNRRMATELFEDIKQAHK